MRFALLWFIVFRCLFFVGLVVGFSNVGLPGVGLPDVGCRIAGCRIAGLLWEWVSAAFWGAFDRAGHKSPTQTPQPPRPRQRKYIRGELNTSVVFDALREKSMNVPVRGVLETEYGFPEREKERESECWARSKGVRSWI